MVEVRIPVEVVQQFHGKRSKIPFDVVQDSVGKRSSFSVLTESWTTCRNRGPHATALGAGEENAALVILGRMFS